MISVIIPVYNVEKYIDQCIQSVINQTYQNFEIILVDDGSPDNCPQICDNWALRDKRIQVIHKKNGGLSDARNCGVEKAKGDFVFFIDSDDYIQENAFEILKSTAINDNTDMVIFEFNRVSENGTLINQNGGTLQTGVFTNLEILGMFSNVTINLVTAWSKLYKTDIAKKIKFPLNKINEDEFTAHKFIYECDMISVIADKLYNYRDNENSIINNIDNFYSVDKLFAIYDRIEFLSKHSLYDAECGQVRSFYLFYRSILPNALLIAKSDTGEIKKMYDILFKRLILLKNFTLCDKMKMICLKYIPKLYSRIYLLMYKYM